MCAKNLEFVPQEISTQILSRDLHADYISTIALIATSIEKFATEIRGLQKSETREVEEFFAKGKKDLQQCHINEIQLVLKIWLDWLV